MTKTQTQTFLDQLDFCLISNTGKNLMINWGLLLNCHSIIVISHISFTSKKSLLVRKRWM